MVFGKKQHLYKAERTSLMQLPAVLRHRKRTGKTICGFCLIFYFMLFLSR